MRILYGLLEEKICKNWGKFWFNLPYSFYDIQLYWPVSTVEENSSTISKLISTSEMKSGKYTVRVSPSRKLRPIGEGIFEIDNRLIPAAFLIPGALLIPQLLLSRSDDTKQEKVESDIVEPEKPPVVIAWLIYTTEKDTKVCKYCAPHEGERYRADDPELPKIPIHPRCRCHYDIISTDEEQQLYSAMWTYANVMQSIRQSEAIDAFNSYRAAKIVWNSS